MEYARIQFTIQWGDFNAKIGSKKIDESQTDLSNFGLECRNNWGTTLLVCLLPNSVYIMNSFFKNKYRRCTWERSVGTTEIEFDYIINCKTDLIKDVTVLNSISRVMFIDWIESTCFNSTSCGDKYLFISCRRDFIFKTSFEEFYFPVNYYSLNFTSCNNLFINQTYISFNNSPMKMFIPHLCFLMVFNLKWTLPTWQPTLQQAGWI